MSPIFLTLPREIRQTILKYAMADAINNELAVCFRTYDTRGNTSQGTQHVEAEILPNDRGYLLSTWFYDPTHKAPRIHHTSTKLRLISVQTNQDMDFVHTQAIKKFDTDHAIIQKLITDYITVNKLTGFRPPILVAKIMSRAFILGSLDLKKSVSNNWKAACQYTDVLRFIEDDEGWISCLEKNSLEYMRRTHAWGHLL